MDTPYTDHLTNEDQNHIYMPAEDSFLLLDALESELPFLEQLQPYVCLEIGCGSGVIIAALAKSLKNSLCLATDINPHACNASKRTAQRNAAQVDIIFCNMVDGLRPNKIDLLVFNPPYVVTTDDELNTKRFCNDSEIADCGNLVSAWAGGIDGRRVIDELLKKLDFVLTPQGVFYLLLLRENKPQEVMERLQELGFNAIKLMDRRIPGEHLFILKITRR